MSEETDLTAVPPEEIPPEVIVAKAEEEAAREKAHPKSLRPVKLPSESPSESGHAD
ncbi:MAG TPA: hypothetical protein VGE29_06285 [Prosthecobacter sp.]